MNNEMRELYKLKKKALRLQTVVAFLTPANFGFILGNVVLTIFNLCTIHSEPLKVFGAVEAAICVVICAISLALNWKVGRLLDRYERRLKRLIFDKMPSVEKVRETK